MVEVNKIVWYILKFTVIKCYLDIVNAFHSVLMRSIGSDCFQCLRKWSLKVMISKSMSVFVCEREGGSLGRDGFPGQHLGFQWNQS